jgi:hypothetical protein
LGGLWHEINDKELSDFKGSVVNREEWGIGWEKTYNFS